MNPNRFPPIVFSGQLRPSQEDVVKIARDKLRQGKRRLHIVAPPGSGKTVLGLFLWAEVIRRPAVVLSPNSAIQAQWAARTSLFTGFDASSDQVSTDPKQPGLLTSLTYQSVTLPQRGSDDLDAQALLLWQDKLVMDEQAQDAVEATIWINDLHKHNPSYYETRLAGYRKRIRDEQAMGGDAFQTLHHSAQSTLLRLKEAGVGLIILDECHHLMGHWGRVLADAQKLFGDPVVVGLTATPPDEDGRTSQDVLRYNEFFGEVDYEVPVPAVVKDGFLAPYQDLAYFVRPTGSELRYIANVDKMLRQIVDTLCQARQPKAVTNVADSFDQSTTPSGADPDEDFLGDFLGDFSDDFSEEFSDEISEEISDDTKRQSRSNAAGSKSKSKSKSKSRAGKTRKGASSNQLQSHQLTPRERSILESLPPRSLQWWIWTVFQEKRLPTGIVKDWKTFERRDPLFAMAGRCFLLRLSIDLPEEIPEPELEVPLAELPEIEFWVPSLDRYVRHFLRRSVHAEEHELAQQTTRQLRTLGVQITETGFQPCASPVGRVMAYSKSKAAALTTVLGVEMEQLQDSIRAVVVADYEKTSAVTADVKHLLNNEAGGAIAAFRSVLSNHTTDQLDPILVTGSSVLIDDDLVEKFFTESKIWLRENRFEVKLSDTAFNGFHEINGKGKDWCPRVYVELITELFQRGTTRCLVGTRGLLGEGWDASRINVLIDLTTVTTSMSVNQLRGRSIRLDANNPEKLANNWDIVCISPEFTKGLDDYQRFKKKHETLFGVTDDGAIEKGVGHVHAAFTQMKPEGLEGSVRLLNADMLARATQREKVRQMWRIGEPYHSEPVHTLETDAVGGAGGFPPFTRTTTEWDSTSLTAAIAKTVLASLVTTGQLQQPFDIQVGERAGGYIRTFLSNATTEENQLFATCMSDVLGPLKRPRYVIPRFIDKTTSTWISKLLPEVLGKFFEKRERSQVMLHAVPTALAKKKSVVEVFQFHWNQWVSPGEATYAHRGEGEDLVAEAKQAGLSPQGHVHRKEIFI